MLHRGLEKPVNKRKLIKIVISFVPLVHRLEIAQFKATVSYTWKCLTVSSTAHRTQREVKKLVFANTARAKKLTQTKFHRLNFQECVENSLVTNRLVNQISVNYKVVR